GSALRLTIARYYTPTGRSIQKPYSAGYAEYVRELFERRAHGELEYSDSIHFADSLKFTTPGGKIVYGGGGIMPDIFVPMDTSFVSAFYSDAFSKGLLGQFAYDYVDQNRKSLLDYNNFEEFNRSFMVSD